MDAAVLVFFGGWALRAPVRACGRGMCAVARFVWGFAAPHPGEGQAGFSEAGSSDEERLPMAGPSSASPRFDGRMVVRGGTSVSVSRSGRAGSLSRIWPGLSHVRAEGFWSGVGLDQKLNEMSGLDSSESAGQDPTGPACRRK